MDQNLRVYENKAENGDIKLDFIGIEHPINEEQVVPTLQKTLKVTIEKLKSSQESGMKLVDLEETIGFLEMLQDMTVPETGYFYAPNCGLEKEPTFVGKEAVEKNKNILTNYGKKLLAEQVAKTN